MDFDWFGYSVQVVENDSHGNSYLLVGAPQYRINGTSVGRLYCFDLQYVGSSHNLRDHRNPIPTVWTVTGNEPRGNFGKLHV
jgi:hypothetical protein